MKTAFTRVGAAARLIWVAMVIALLGSVGTAQAQVPSSNVDLVVTLVADAPAYLAGDPEHYTVTISNNGPATATAVDLVVTHPQADVPFEASAVCQPVAGANPNGPATCPPGSSTAPSAAFVRTGNSFRTTIPAIPAQSMVRITFENRTRCAAPDGQGAVEPQRICIMPEGAQLITAQVSSPQNDVHAPTNTATTNIFYYPTDSQYRIEITRAPATAMPGEIVEYEFDVISMGLHPSYDLTLNAYLYGRNGSLTPVSTGNAIHGAMTSTLPDTRLLSIDCVSMSLGTFPASDVFPASPQPWQSCPSTGLIPIPRPVSNNNSNPVYGFDGNIFLKDLPGTSHIAGGGVMRFRARVEVGRPLCVTAPESGHRDLEFRVMVSGVPGTDTVAPGWMDNEDVATTQVAAVCEAADIQFSTAANPAVMTLDGNNEAQFTQTSTVTNNGPNDATQVPVEFGHHGVLFSQTRTALACTSAPAGLCPDAAALAAGVVLDTNVGFRFSGNIASLPAGAVVTFTQNITVKRDECWTGQAGLNLSGRALPAPGLFDPNYNTSVGEPPAFTPGINAFFGNNGMQTVADVNGVDPCPGGSGGNPPVVRVVKSGPYASAADAANNGPLIGQTAATAIADGTQVFFKIEVENPRSVGDITLHNISDSNFFAAMGSVHDTPDSGFIFTGSSLADWGIGCTSTGLATCHDMARSFISDGYNRYFSLAYDPTQHGGNTGLTLGPRASLAYVVPFTTPTHLNRCHGPRQVRNNVDVMYQRPLSEALSTESDDVNYYIGGPACVPGALQVQKEILAPATSNFIPASGEVSFRLTLTNLSTTETLDIARLRDQFSHAGVQASVVNITCNPTGGAQCPSTPIVPGMQTPASGTPVPLSNPVEIDHEWGAIGQNTFPPGSSLELEITYRLSEPTRRFGCLMNSATFSGENDPNGWVSSTDQKNLCQPYGPELSLQKQVDAQILAPDAWVTYTLTIINIGTASADGALLQDDMPASLLAANPSGYSNITCTNITNSPFMPNPHGVAACPSISSGPGGLSATIASLGPNTALQITYQAKMPDAASAPVSVENLASIYPPAGPGGFSFSPGTSQSHQNVQVTASAGTGTPPQPVAVPALEVRWIMLLTLGLLLVGVWRMPRSQ